MSIRIHISSFRQLTDGMRNCSFSFGFTLLGTLKSPSTHVVLFVFPVTYRTDDERCTRAYQYLDAGVACALRNHQW